MQPTRCLRAFACGVLIAFIVACLLLLVALIISGPPAIAQGTYLRNANGAPYTALLGCDGLTPASPTNPACTDSGAYQGAVPLTVGSPDTQARRSLGFVCSGSGTLTLLLADGSSIAVPIQGSSYFQTLPFAVREITASTASCSGLWNMR